MEKSNSGMHGHGMPIETRPIEHKPIDENNYPHGPNQGQTETIKVHKAKSKPFLIIEKETDENKTFEIAIGQDIISEKKFNSYDEAQRYIGSKPWEIIINLACLIYQIEKENEKSQS